MAEGQALGRRPGAARPETGRQGLNSQEADGLIAGFDAGQTHTSCRLAMADGSPVAEGEGPGACHLAAADGPERFQEALRQSFAAACRQIGDQKQRDRLGPVESGDSEGDTTRPDPQLLAAAVGASGIEQGSDVQELGLTLAGAAEATSAATSAWDGSTGTGTDADARGPADLRAAAARRTD